jgi:phage/plasmid-like protein (TIGR03299 family)
MGTVGPKYRILQNSEAFKFFQSWLDTKEIALHTAGSVFDGKKVWVLAQITKDPLMDIVKDDSVAKFLLLSNGHDGTTSVRVGFSPIRVVCANTLRMAHHNGQLIRLIHSRQLQNNLADIKQTINLINQEFETTAEQYKYLATRHINAADLKKYVKVVLDVKEDDKDIKTRQANIITDIVNMMDAPEQQIVGVRGTYWAAYNAINGYFNHKYGRNDNNRLNNMWFGKGDNFALKTALELAV